jgi:hypothetical protein
MQANGLVERFNQTIQNMLVKFIDQKKENWQDFLDSCVYAYNTAKHESTKFSPFEIMFSRKGLLPVDFLDTPNCSDELQFSYDEAVKALSEHTEERRQQLEVVKKNILQAQAMQKKQYDRKHHKPEVFKVGSIVLKKDFLRKKRAKGKLDPKWKGPYRIIRSLGRGLYGLELVDDPTKVVSRVNGIHIKPYHFKKSANVDLSTSQPLHSDLSIGQPINPDSTTSQPVDPEPSTSQPLHSDLSIGQPINPDPTTSQTINPDSTTSQPVNPEPSTSQSVNPNLTGQTVNLNLTGQPDNLDLSKGQPDNADFYTGQPDKVDLSTGQSMDFSTNQSIDMDDMDFIASQPSILDLFTSQSIDHSHQLIGIESFTYEALHNSGVITSTPVWEGSYFGDFDSDESAISVPSTSTSAPPCTLANTDPTISKPTTTPAFTSANTDATVSKPTFENSSPASLTRPMAISKGSSPPASAITSPIDMIIPPPAANMYCECRMRCATKKCPCRKKGSSCGSQCHPGRSCANIVHSQADVTFINLSDGIDEPGSQDCWLIIGGIRLTNEDKKDLGSRSHAWLNDKHIAAAQYLLKRQHPHIAGMQEPTLQLTRTFDIHGERQFIQILNSSRSHWITVSTVSCQPDVIRVYDSMLSRLNPSLKRTIADLMF